MTLRALFMFFLSLPGLAATSDDTRGYLSALSDFLESHQLGETELNRIIDGCENGEMVNPILQSAADINPITQVYREALQSWITPGNLNATAVCEFAKSRLSDEARQKEEQKRAKEKTAGIFHPAPSVLSAAGDYTCAIQHDNQVVCWDFWSEQPLGAPRGLRAKSVVAGSRMACAVQLDDTLACWGDLVDMPTPGSLGPVQSVAIGAVHACAVQLDNTLVCWGKNYNHQLDAPANLGNIQSISAGLFHTCAVTMSGTLSCWGNNTYGQLDVPPKLGLIKSVTAGEYSTCAIDSDETLTCWGNGHVGSTPPHDLGQVTFVVAGARRACAKKMDGTFVCWKNSALDARNIGPFKSVTLGDTHACGVELDDSVRCWNLDDLTPLWSPEGLKVLASEAKP